MTQTKDVTVLFKVLDGTWEAVGSNRARGTWPEGVTLAADHWGPSKASFSLHRDPLALWPDISAFTPVNIEVGGTLVWSGRVSETPTSQSQRVINVQCEGWQYHLDDDVYQNSYVHAKLSDWKDCRSIPDAGLSLLPANLVVQSEQGVTSIGWPTGIPFVSGTDVGVTLDFGVGSLAKYISVDYDSIGVTAGPFVLTARAHNTPSFLMPAVFDTAFSGNPAAGPTTVAGAFTTGYRYVTVFLTITATGTPTGADSLVRLRAIRVFGDSTYQTAGLSTLKATTIIPDALTKATLLLSPDRSMIDPGATVSFSFPEFAMDGQKTPREVLSAANAVHDYQLKVDARRRVVFNPKPSAALMEIGEWPGSSFEDASANSGDEIFNRVVVEGTAADGEKLTVERSASQTAGLVPEPITSPAPNNPSFVTDTASWTASTSTVITRDTVVFDSSPASGRWDRGVGVSLVQGDQLTETFTGTFRAGVTYTLLVWVQTGGTATSNALKLIFGVLSTGDAASQSIKLTTAVPAMQVSVAWTPLTDQAAATLLIHKMSTTGGTGWINVDTLTLTVSPRPTLVDKRGFRRTHVLPVKSSLTTELATQIATVWLAAHQTTPLKGTVRIEGDKATREMLTGAPVPPELLLLRTGELLRLSDRVDPDTGGQGRNGRIAEVTYSHPDNSATVALDSRRTSHEALLERLAVVVGSA